MHHLPKRQLHSHQPLIFFAALLGSALFSISSASTAHAACGDATVDVGEECDDGNLVNGDGCDNACDREGGAGACDDTESTFEINIEDWDTVSLVNDSSPPNNEKNDGVNPDNYWDATDTYANHANGVDAVPHYDGVEDAAIQGDPAGSSATFWLAPAAYTGDRSDLWGAEFSWTHKTDQTSGIPAEREGIFQIWGAGMEIVYKEELEPATPAINTPQTVKVTIAAPNFRHNRHDTGAQVTEMELATILANVTRIMMRGEYNGANPSELIYLLGVDADTQCDPGCGADIECADAVACTTDTCDLMTGICSNTPDDGACDDTNECTADSCDAMSGCSNTDVASGTSCNGGADQCDGAGSCVDCVDDSGCSGGTPVCDVGTNTCVECLGDGDCDDGVACTTDTCAANSCTNTPVDAACDDSNECTADSCDAMMGCDNSPTASGSMCTVGGNQCDGLGTCVECVDDTPCGGSTPLCDVGSNTCVECLVNGDCDDGVACTVDTCTAGVCSNPTSDALCTDGDECTDDICNTMTGCSNPNSASGTMCTVGGNQCDGAGNCVECVDNDPCSGTTPVCDVPINTCIGCTADIECDDGVSCTDDTCNGGTGECTNATNDANCDDGAFCNGNETCDAVLDCQAGTDVDCDDADACTTDSCNEGTNMCDNTAVDCDDSNECTADSCDMMTGCDNAPTALGSACTVGGNQCDGAGTCVECVNDSACSGGTPFCETGSNTCVECLVDGSCDDGVACTVDTCDTNSCNNTTSDALCDDGNECTVNTCDAMSGCGTVDVASGGACTVGGNQCDGAGTCVECVNDSACSGGTPFCDVLSNTCVACINDGDCDDSNECTDDVCTMGVGCSNDPTPVDSACTVGGNQCDGAGTCVECTTDTPCSGDTPLCNTGTNMCVECLSDLDCTDPFVCDIPMSECVLPNNDDNDMDGVPDLLDVDDDNDGILDEDEGTGDSDGDGVIDSQDLDSDNDGIPDLWENGGRDLDQNDDGQLDGDDNPSDVEDSDGDGLLSAFDSDEGGSLPTDPVDSDDDGVPNYLDLDSDDDGICDVVEATSSADLATVDANGDCTLAEAPSGDIIDTNDNGLHDPREAGPIPDVNSDGDAMPDYLDTDSDNDSVPDATEGHDLDGDGEPDVDPSPGEDADGDGLQDAYDMTSGGTEAPIPNHDPGEDILPDFRDTDDDGDGIDTETEVDDAELFDLEDSDDDGSPNYLDDDADGDGEIDGDEDPDTNNNLVPDYLEVLYDLGVGGVSGGAFCSVSSQNAGSSFAIFALLLVGLAGFGRSRRR